MKISTNAKQVKKRLRRVRKIGVNKAWKATLDDMAILIAKALVRQWRRDMEVKKSTFAGYSVGRVSNKMLVVSKAYVDFDTGTLKHGAEVWNAHADELLERQIEGGVRRPTKGHKVLYIPVKGAPRPRVPKTGKRKRRKNTVLKPSKGQLGGVLYQGRKTGVGQRLAVLTPRAVTKARFRISPPIKAAERRFSKVAEIHFRRELKRAWEKGFR